MVKPQTEAVAVDEEDPVLTVIRDLRDEAKSAFAAVKKKVDTGIITDIPALAREFVDMFSILVDVTEATFTAHTEHFEWAGEVDEELDAIKGEGMSQLLPSDADALKGTLLALVENLRASLGPDDTLPDLLRAKVTETISFIDSITGEPDDDEEEDDDADEDDDKQD